MGIKFNADEVLKMAIRTEENGAAFYRKAAELNKDGNAGFLLELAEMEDSHAKTFQEMADSLTDDEKKETTYDPMGETELYLAAMTDSQEVEGAPAITEKLTGDESMQEILNIAIGLEKESILFYMGLMEKVPARLGKGKIEEIIAEERSHVATLAMHRKEA